MKKYWIALSGALLTAATAVGSTATVSTCSFGVAGSIDTLIAAASTGDTINFNLDCSGANAIPFTTDIFIKDKGLSIDGTGHTIELNGGWTGTYDTTMSDTNFGYATGGTSLFVVVASSSALTLNFTNLTFENGNGFVNGGPAGAISNTKDVVNVTNCLFRGNVGNEGGALFAQNNSTIHVTGSTFTGNVSPSIPSLSSGFGAVIDNNGTLTVTNSTFNGNSITGTGAGAGGAIYSSGPSMTITSCTIVGNSAGASGDGGGLSGNATVSNSIIYGNTAMSGADASGSYSSDGTNLIGVAATGFGGADIIGQNPLLASLGSHGGATQTMPLLPGSPAIDAISSADCQTTADQRGISRPQPSGGSCDIGAFESQGFSLALSGGNNQSTNINTSFTNPLGVTVTATKAASPDSEPVAGGKVTFTPPGSGASASLTTSPATIAGNGSASVTAAANGTTGSYAVSASAAGASSGVSFSLTNTCPTASFSSGNPTDGAFDVPYFFQFSENGLPGTVTWSEVGALPNNVTFSTAGTLSGTPTQSGPFPISVTAQSSSSCNLTGSFTLTILSPITISPAVLADATYNQNYSQQLTASGGTGSGYSFSIGSGSPPGNVTLTPSGLISGPPAAAGTFNFTVHATDSGEGAVTQSYSLTVDQISCVVTSTSDPSDAGHLTLRDAVTAVDAAACTGNLITFDGTVFPAAGPAQTITLGNVLTISHDATVEGTGARLLILNGSSSGGFDVTSGTVGISGMTIQHATDSAVQNLGTLTLSDMTLTSNSALFGGALNNSGNATVERLTFSNNSGTNDGGAIFNAGSGSITIVNSTFNGNSSEGGHALYLEAGSVTMTNDTVVGNGDGTSDGGVIQRQAGTITLSNTLVGGNTSPNCSGSVTSAGHNIDSDGTCAFGQSGDISSGSVTMNVGSLGNHGGPTDTIALHGGSSAIDAADGTICAAAPVSGIDQRGNTRPVGAGCDIGALEAAQHTLSATITGPGTVSASVATPISGSISSCASSCSAIYSGEDGGDAVTLSAVPATGAAFSTWGADCGSTAGNSANVTMNIDHACSATFAYLAPTASGGSFSTPFGVPLSQSVAVNDPTGGTLTVDVTSITVNGALTGPDATGAFTYTPGTAFYGTDSFTFTVTSPISGLTSGPATVNITVQDPVAPTANPATVATIYLRPLAITLTATLPSGAEPDLRANAIATLSFAIASGPSHGTLSNFDSTTGQVTYTADGNFIGTDSFTFTATYGPNTSAPATVTIDVNGAADTPMLDARMLALLAALLAAAAFWRLRRQG